MSKDIEKPNTLKPSDYNYNKSNYVVLTSGVRREASSGRFIEIVSSKK